jgi:hypothetical protein
MPSIIDLLVPQHPTTSNTSTFQYLQMANAADIQSLLRFLSQDAKVPLATAMSKVKELQSAGLGT